MRAIYADFAATITELKANPNLLLEKSGGSPIAILSHNEPRAYLVPVDAFEAMQEMIDDYRLMLEVRQRENEPSVRVTIDELRAEIQADRAKAVEKTGSDD